MTTSTKLPTWYWVIAVIALLWNLMGVSAYIADAYSMIELTPEEAAFKEHSPAWFTAAYAIAVFTGLLASIALLTRKKWAVVVFLISLIAVIILLIYEFFMQDDLAMTGGRAVMPILVFIIAALLYWFSKGAREKAWLS